MPTKDDPRITVRLGQELYGFLREAADKRGISIGEMVREACLAHTQPRLVRVNETATVVPALKSSLGCPVPGCDFTAKSGVARCPVHNRQVV